MAASRLCILGWVLAVAGPWCLPAQAQRQSCRLRPTAIPKRPASARPAFDLSVGSTKGFPFVVHAPTGYLTLAERVRDEADKAWQREFIELGWQTPPPDSLGPDSRFDIYLDATLSEGQAYVDGDSTVASTPWYDMTSYMALSLDFASDDQLVSYVNHELNHAAHYAIDAAEDDAFFEHAATLVEAQLAHRVAIYGVGIADFQQHPERALNFMGTDYSEYGGVLWLMFLSEHYDQGQENLVQQLWLLSRQNNPTNEPDFLDSLATLLSQRQVSFAEFFGTFAGWRYFTGSRDDGKHFQDGKLWGTASHVPVSALSLGADIAANTGAMGSTYRQADIPAGTTDLRISLSTADSVATAIFLDSAGRQVGGLALVKFGDLNGIVSIPTGASRVVLAVSWVPTNWDPDSKDWTTHAMTVRVDPLTLDAGTVADAGTPDGGQPVDAGEQDAGASDAGLADAGTNGTTPGQPEPSGGCHCSTGSGAIAALAWALGLAALRRGARRRTGRAGH